MKTSIAIQIIGQHTYDRFEYCTMKTTNGALIIKRYGIFTIKIYAPGKWEYAFASIHLENDI